MFYQIFSLIALILFYGCYLRKMLTQKKAGIQTDQLGRGKVGLPKWIEILTKISTYFVVAAEVVSILLNTNAFPLWLRITGLIFTAAGVLLFILSVYTMKDSWRAGVPLTDNTSLVTTGVFRYSRNPAFLGFDLTYIGIVYTFFNLALFLISVLAILMLHLQIVNNEEPFLQDAFGEKYLEYKRHVNRYCGRRK